MADAAVATNTFISKYRKNHQLLASSNESISDGGRRKILTESNQKTVYTVDLCSINLKEIPDLIKYKHCKSIDLSCNQIFVVREKVFQHCPSLKELKLYSNKLERLDGIKTLFHLESIQLQYNALTRIGDCLKGCGHLKYLRLDSNKLPSVQSAEICSLHHLTYLDISSNDIEDISFIISLVAIEEFLCTHNNVRTIPKTKILKKLHHIDISYNNIKNVDGLKSTFSLNTITLEGNKIKCLKSIDSLSSLFDLNISHNQLSTMQHIAQQFVNIELLNISNNNIADVKEFEYLSFLHHLKELQVLGNPITNSDIENVDNVIPKLSLEYYNNRCLEKHRVKCPPSAMRPMSANQMVSERLIQDQLAFTENSLDECQKQLNSQFAGITEMLHNLSSARPTSACRSGTPSKHLFQSKGPLSRCSSRSRIAEAKAFATRNVESSKK